MHESVLLHETIAGLELKAGDVLVDGTLGRAGHALEALRVEPGISIVGIDRDEQAIEESTAKLAAVTKDFKIFFGNFRDMDKFVAKADKIILDLGISSPHLDSSGRGFSFQKDEPLLMTMRRDLGEADFTARDIVNGWEEEDIANVLYAYGDERYSRRIAKAIVLAREEKPIETTFELVDIIKGSVPGIYRKGKIHPATRSFQALRIAVNDELGSLRQGLKTGFSVLAPGGRMAVISFHSLEDRIVKNFMRDAEKEGLGHSLTKKPIVPSEEETRRNPRSRSSKLRIFIKN
ncbi:MAG: 16S rRNA (cytosine(1402)-N(4))-methyltransferase RsmH [Candidatus Paceibacterota bacterium]|jgi:16S rRNA (cytosine1402-N4)-methyltransferase